MLDSETYTLSPDPQVFLELRFGPAVSADVLRELLCPHFTMLDEPQDVEFVIRETRRKFQHTISELTAWERI